MKYEKGGRTFEFSLDYDKIADMEEADPSFDLMGILDSFGDGKVRFCEIRKLSRLIGMEFSELKEKGLDISDLLNIFTGCINEMGFHSDPSE